MLARIRARILTVEKGDSKMGMGSLEKKCGVEWEVEVIYPRLCMCVCMHTYKYTKRCICRHIYVCVCAKSFQLRLTLCDASPPAPLFMRLWRQEYWSGLPCSPLRDLPNSGIKPGLLQLLNYRQILYHWATREAPYVCVLAYKHIYPISVHWKGLEAMTVQYQRT